MPGIRRISVPGLGALATLHANIELLVRNGAGWPRETSRVAAGDCEALQYVNSDHPGAQVAL